MGYAKTDNRQFEQPWHQYHGTRVRQWLFGLIGPSHPSHACSCNTPLTFSNLSNADSSYCGGRHVVCPILPARLKCTFATCCISMTQRCTHRTCVHAACMLLYMYVLYTAILQHACYYILTYSFTQLYNMLTSYRLRGGRIMALLHRPFTANRKYVSTPQTLMFQHPKP